MPPKSIELGHLPARSFLSVLINSQFRTKIQRAPVGTNISGQIAVITGASTGLGLHCANHLLSLGLSYLIVAVRSPEKGEAAAKELRASYPLARVEVWSLEMSSYPSILAFCRRVEAELPRLDVAILNAGCTSMHFTLCPETGHEQVVQINYLSTFLLAVLMLPILQKKKSANGRPGRLTIVSSGVALYANFLNRNERPLLASFDDPNTQPWDPAERYHVSKALGHMFFARMLKYLNDDVVVNLVDPGLCKGSELHRTATGIMKYGMKVAKSLSGRTLDDGAWTYVDAAVVKGIESNGCYIMDCKIHPFASWVYDPNAQAIMDALWEETMAEFEDFGARRILENFKTGSD